MITMVSINNKEIGWYTFSRDFYIHVGDNLNHAIMILLNWRYAILTHMSVAVVAPTCQ
jgi:hypothetical protein